jgi:hypothetical protein
MGFPGRGFRQERTYVDPYGSDSEGYSRRRQNIREERQQRQSYARVLGGQQLPFIGMGNPEGMAGIGGFQSPFMARERPSPMMGGCSPSGCPSPFGTGMGMGLGVGIGSDMRMRMGMGMGIGMGPPLGGIAYPGRHPFMDGPPMRYRQPSPFDLVNPHRSPPVFLNRNRHLDQSFFHPKCQRDPFSLFPPNFYDDNDESDFDTSSIFTCPRRRGEAFRHLGRSPYRNQGRSNWMYGGFKPAYDEFDDLDDDDESDFEDYIPRRRLPRY